MAVNRGLRRFIFSAIFVIFPLISVLSWACFFFLSFPFAGNGATKNASAQRKPEIGPWSIVVDARRSNSSGSFVSPKVIDLNKTVLYIDMWRSHWCTYYNDREFFFTPRINEMAQRLRMVGVPVVDISLSIDAFSPDAISRKRGRKIVEKGAIDVLEKFHARAMLYHKDYIPGFEDVCVYSELLRFGEYRDNSLSKQIAVTDEDYYVANFKESAEAFVGLGAKHVIILGQHTNMCLMAVFLYCREVGLDLIIVRDLVDGCWVFEKQKEHCKTHTEGNAAINKYFEREFGSSVLSYDLIRSLEKAHLQKTRPNYTRFTNHAFMFKNI